MIVASKRPEKVEAVNADEFVKTHYIHNAGLDETKRNAQPCSGWLDEALSFNRGNGTWSIVGTTFPRSHLANLWLVHHVSGRTEVLTNAVFAEQYATDLLDGFTATEKQALVYLWERGDDHELISAAFGLSPALFRLFIATYEKPQAAAVTA